MSEREEKVIGEVTAEIQTMQHHMCMTMEGVDFESEVAKGSIRPVIGGLGFYVSLDDYGVFEGVPYTHRAATVMFDGQTVLTETLAALATEAGVEMPEE